MAFSTPPSEPFRARLQQAGYYAKWKEAFGPEVWGLLEKYTSKLA